MKKVRKQVISFTFDAETIKVLDEMAAQRNMNRSQVMELAVRELQLIHDTTGLSYDQIPSSAIANTFRKAIREYEKWRGVIEKILSEGEPQNLVALKKEAKRTHKE